ncbi:hypothetical protein ERJ75_000253000 [Trypanosoma vivax]|nr:hypothetical protein ERJ75_000253000 [Trypanosoma vivax]
MPREAASNSGRSDAQLRQASGSAGKRSANTQTAEGVRKRRWHHKSDGPRSAPPIFGVGSKTCRQANADGASVGAENVHNETPRRIRKSTRPGNVAGERAAFYCEFEAGEKQRRAAHKGAVIADGVGEAPAQMLPSGLRGAAAENPTRRTPPMMRWEPHLVCNAMGSERGRVAMQLAWVAAGRCDEIALLQKKNCIRHPSDRNALIVDLGALPKTFEADTRRAARFVAIPGADATRDGKTYCKNGGLGAARRTWRARFGKNLVALRRDGGRTRFWPESSDAAGETRGPTRNAMRHRAVPGTLGRRFEQLHEVEGPHV